MITFSRLGRYGQLGNQLFQVSLLLGVAAKTGYEVAIPKRFRGHKKRGLVELEPFEIKITALPMRVSGSRFRIYRENGFPFNPQVFTQPDWTDYQGYFQTEKYFVHIEEKIREQFRFKSNIVDYASQFVYKERETENVVAIHVRRGDYLDKPDLFHVLTPDYYNWAVHHPKLPPNRQFMVFSDDIPWCTENLNLTSDKTTFVTSPSHWHDLAIMTFCDHHIIAASSFSWWAAWLSHNRKNVVIAPNPWFPTTNQRGWDDRDIVPERWEKLNVYGN
jgi:hypothetical protein